MTVNTTLILNELSLGRRERLGELVHLLYSELKSLAESQLSSERQDHTLSATALVHEAYLRLMDQNEMNWRNRPHFLAVAATIMRRVLVDHARRRNSQKRGGLVAREAIEVPQLEGEDGSVIDVLLIDDALRSLAELHDRHAKVVEMRFFGGMTNAEVSSVLGVTERTVKNDWRAARAWLICHLSESNEA